MHCMKHKSHRFLGILTVVLCFVALPSVVDAATLRINPGTGVYTVGSAFTASVIINTDGKSINAADGQITFNPRELQVVNVGRGGSIFNLWTEEPTFSNSAGTISFGGGSPSGYKGAAGNIITITFRPLAAGNPKVNFKTGSILAADGMGTNILTGMSGGTYTVSAPAETPEPEYIAPANTPSAPVISSLTHSSDGWSKEKTAKLTWTLPSDVVAVRMLLDDSPNTIPTNVYDERLTSRTIEDLDEGISYFHLQFKNADGWGRVGHYRLAVDTVSPEGFSVTQASSTDDVVGTPLVFTYEDVSPVTTYKIIIDGGEPIYFEDKEQTKQYTLGVLEPGSHTVIVEVYDSAGNSSLATYSFTIEAFEKPIFTQYPERINTGVIPAFKGTTRPNALVTIEMSLKGSDTHERTVVEASDTGEFVFIPENELEQGVYIVTAQSQDSAGRVSERSDEIHVIVEAPGYIAIGMFVVSVLSVIVPLVALVFMLVVGAWFMWFRFARWRRKVRKETYEIETSLTHEFGEIVTNLNIKVDELLKSRRGKLTKAETALIEQIQSDIRSAQEKIAKEVEDVEKIIK